MVVLLLGLSIIDFASTVIFEQYFWYFEQKIFEVFENIELNIVFSNYLIGNKKYRIIENTDYIVLPIKSNKSHFFINIINN